MNPGVHPNCRRWLACVMKSCHMPRGHKTLTECLQLQWGQGFLTDQQTPGGRGGSRAFLFSVQSRTNRATWNLLEILGPSPPPHQNVHLHEPQGLFSPPHPTPPHPTHFTPKMWEGSPCRLLEKSLPYFSDGPTWDSVNLHFHLQKQDEESRGCLRAIWCILHHT